MSRRIVGPFNRVEGDLEVRLEIEGDRVREAFVTSPLYRGFESMLADKDPGDALVLTPRICGICSVAQSYAAATALAEAQGISPPPNGALLRNIVLAAENVADHLTHFYLFFMPDFARAVYAAEPWHADILARFHALEGRSVREWINARSAFMHLMGELAGHWPHTLGLQPGGMTHAIDNAGRVRVLAVLATLRAHLEARVFGESLEAVAAIPSLEALLAWAERPGVGESDLAAFVRLIPILGLDRLGRGSSRFMSYGAYSLGGGHLFARGVFADGKRERLDPSEIAEDTTSAWYAGAKARHPRQGATVPDADRAGAYTWCKAPRLAGAVVEVGALARQVVDGLPLARSLLGADGKGSVAARVVARMVELARTVPAMERWIREIVVGEPFFNRSSTADTAEGVGQIEAARGSLGHWVAIRGGRIASYQIIAPTTWNFSPRDANGIPGPCEQALAGAPLRSGEESPVSVQHIVRSFDPCMVCTVH